MGVVVRQITSLATVVVLAVPAAGNAAPRGYEGPVDVAADPEAVDVATHEPAEPTPPPAPEPVEDGSIEDDSIEDDSIEDGSIEDDSIEDGEGSIEDEVDGPAVSVDWRDEPEGEVASRRIRGGALLLAGGAFVVIGAVILGSTDPCRRLAGNGCQKAARTRGVVTMAVPGSLAMAGGVMLTVIGVRQRARVRASLETPLSGNRTWGMALRAHF